MNNDKFSPFAFNSREVPKTISVDLNNFLIKLSL